MKADRARRRSFLRASFAALAATMLTACQRLTESTWFPQILATGETLSRNVSQLLGRKAMAQEFAPSDISPTFRSNGTSSPESDSYRQLVETKFGTYSLVVDGLVEHKRSFSLAELRALPSRTQITRHDCVEGWSAIAKWKGVRLSAILEQVKPTAVARYVVFHCADPMEADGSSPYYESIDFDDALHEQTILAYELNDAALPVENGAPLRLRVERQLGYKHAKYVMRIEVVESFAGIAGGKGGYWEDNGYQWFAGI